MDDVEVADYTGPVLDDVYQACMITDDGHHRMDEFRDENEVVPEMFEM